MSKRNMIAVTILNPATALLEVLEYTVLSLVVVMVDLVVFGINVVILVVAKLDDVVDPDVVTLEVGILVEDDVEVVVGRDVDVSNVVVLVIGMLVVVLGSDVVVLDVVVLVVDNVGVVVGCDVDV